MSSGLSTQPPITRPGNDPWLPSTIQAWAERYGCAVSDVCVICLIQIKTQIYRNSGVCCEAHRKDRDNDHEPFQAVNLRIHEGEDL